jgi:hypothetical protein
VSIGASSRISTRPISIKVFKLLGLTGVNFVRLALILRSAQRRRIAVSKSNPANGERVCAAAVPWNANGVCRQPALHLSLRPRARLQQLQTGPLRRSAGQWEGSGPRHRKLVSLCGIAQRSFRPVMSFLRLQPQFYKPAPASWPAPNGLAGKSNYALSLSMSKSRSKSGGSNWCPAESVI